MNKIVEVSDACMSDAGRAFGIDDAEAALRAGELPMATIWASRAAQMDDPESSLVVGLIEFGPAIRTNADSLRNGPAYVDYYAIPDNGSVDPETVFLAIMAAVDTESQEATAAQAAVARLVSRTRTAHVTVKRRRSQSPRASVPESRTQHYRLRKRCWVTPCWKLPPAM